MGNSQSQAPVAVSKPEAVVPKQEERHEMLVNEQGEVSCSCGYGCRTKHMYNIHIEHHCPQLPPIDPTGWPTRHFETVPYVNNTQKGVVSKGTISHASFTSSNLSDNFRDLRAHPMTVKLKQGFNEEEVRNVLSMVPEATNLAASENPKDNVVSVVAVENLIWRKWDQRAPKELKSFVEKKSKQGEVLFPATGGDIFFLVKSEQTHICYSLSKKLIDVLGNNVESHTVTLGFRYNGKDLTGFIDGTRNPDHLLRAIVDEAVIFPGDDQLDSSKPKKKLIVDNNNESKQEDNEEKEVAESDKAHVGGSYMYAGRFVHNLPKFFAMSTEEKSAIIGRHYHREEPHRGYDRRIENPRLDNPPPTAHTQLAHASIYRHAYPYREDKEEGLYFVAFARFQSELESAINRMCGHEIESGVDNLFSITKAVTSNYYYVPSLSELKELGTSNKLYASLPLAVSSENENKEEKSNVNSKPVKIFIEYCTNCGYKTIFLEKKKVLESVSPNVVVIGNKEMPRLSAFEITTETGVVLWSKLSQPDGRNNLPHVFPKNEHLVKELSKFLGLENCAVPQDAVPIYKDEGTRVGVW